MSSPVGGRGPASAIGSERTVRTGGGGVSRLTRGAAFALLVVVALPLAAMPSVAHAQNWRTIELSRQLRDTAEHRVRVTYGRGRFLLFANESPLLYDARIRYDEAAATPRSSYDAASHALDIGVHHDDEAGGGSQHMGEMRLTLAPGVPLDLDLQLGAVESEIELGGLAVRELSVDVSASRASVTFDEPNRTAMRMLDLHASAASLVATRLANANAAEMRFGAGVGSVELDFGGRWSQDIAATVDVAVGRVRIRVPESVGVRVEMSRVLARFEHPDFGRQGDAYVSANWESAEYRLTLRIDTAFGTVEIERGGN